MARVEDRVGTKANRRKPEQTDAGRLMREYLHGSLLHREDWYYNATCHCPNRPWL